MIIVLPGELKSPRADPRAGIKLLLSMVNGHREPQSEGFTLILQTANRKTILFTCCALA
jgi:hypothetical protein